MSSPNYALGVELCAALLLGFVIIWLAPTLNPLLLLLVGATIIAISVGASWYFYAQNRLLFDFTYPLMSSILVYLTLVFSNYIREQAQRRRIRSAFGQYLRRALVEQLAQSPEKLVLGGEEREMTILFSDVRGFTTISETYKDDPQGLTSLMNSFLTPLTNAIIERKGTIDKYMGDAIMAFWNAPLDDADHEINACEAALDMLRRVDALNSQREQQAKESGQRFIPIKVGVGINTGRCVVGNMGSDLRFDYSVLGDTVNLASRLEGQSKNTACRSLSDHARRGGQGQVRDPGARLHHGRKARPSRSRSIPFLAARTSPGSDRFGQLRQNVNDMLTRFRQQDFSGATQAIERCRKFGDGFGLGYLFDLYSERIRVFEENPPPADWNGVFVARDEIAPRRRGDAARFLRFLRHCDHLCPT